MGSNLHGQVGVAHATIYGQLRQDFAAVLFHRIQNGFGLEARCFKSCASDVAFLGVLSDANFACQVLDAYKLSTGLKLTYCSFCIVNPVWGKKPTESRHEYASTIVINR